MDRFADWDGFYNTRDLGGLPTTDGRHVRRHALVRGAAPQFVTAAGWAAAHAAGIRTLLDLRNDDELTTDATAPPAGIGRIHIAVDDVADQAFWQRIRDERTDGTPLYYHHVLRDKLPLTVAAVTAVADAPPGGVLFHCRVGRDRTGLLAALLLTLLGVPADIIAADYELSTEPLRALYARTGEPDLGPLLAAMLTAKGTTAGAALLTFLAEHDIETTLRAGGLSPASLARLRARALTD